MNKPLWVSLSAVLAFACGSPSDDGADGPPIFGNPPAGGNAGAGAGVGGASGGGTSGAGSVVGQGGNAVGQGGVANTPSGNGGEGTGNVGQVPANGGTGNNATGGTGNPSNGGGPGNGGGGGEPGGFVSVPRNGGASAAFICGSNQSFVDPFDGAIGNVVTVPRPNPGYSFTEGPIWVAGLGALFFSDNVDPEKIWELVPTSPAAMPTILLNPSHSNGMALDHDDMLLVADQDANKIVRVNPANGAILGDVVPTGNYRPNDLILRSDGNLYFTDPNSAGRGFYRVSPGGQISGPFTQSNAPNAPNNPNGIVLSPDENTLYITDVFGRFVSSFALLADGALDAGTGVVLMNNTGNLADGMAVDCSGNLYLGTEGGVQVFDASGNSLGTLMQGVYASNCTFGGPDRNTLFVTSQGEIRSVTLSVRGLPN